jgi:hypothetical protein
MSPDTNTVLNHPILNNSTQKCFCTCDEVLDCVSTGGRATPSYSSCIYDADDLIEIKKENEDQLSETLHMHDISMRFQWTLTETVEEVTLTCLRNCSFLLLDKSVVFGKRKGSLYSILPSLYQPPMWTMGLFCVGAISNMPACAAFFRFTCKTQNPAYQVCRCQKFTRCQNDYFTTLNYKQDTP